MVDHGRPFHVVSARYYIQGGMMSVWAIGLRWVMLAVAVLCCAAGGVQAAPSAAEISGEIERLTLNDPADVYSGGIMIVAGTQVILPKNLLLDLPANRLTLQQLFAQAPATCAAKGESGLAKADNCISGGTGGFATLSGVHTNAGNIIAGDVLIEKGTDVVSGVVSYINYADGYFRVNGLTGDPATGAMVRLNDPTSRHTIQQGAGCAGGPNCSPDPRFTLDPDNYVNVFSTGYPFCIPSTVPRTFTDVLGLGTTIAQSSPAGTGDVLCPATNRTAAAVEPPVADSRRFAPLLVGDSVNAKGNYEMISGVRFLSAHTTKILKALSTQNLPTQPDYMFLQEAFLEAPGFQNQRARMLLIGMTTLAPTDVDFWTLHRDPVSNSVHEFPLASVQGCDIATAAPGTCSNQGIIGAGANIFRIRYDVDFLLAASGNPKFPGGARVDLNPCMQLMASPRFAISSPGICFNGGVSLANNFGIMSPIPHEIQARTGHSLDHPGLITLDINGNQATNGQYLFPFGINLGGVETADFLEIDVNLLSTPRAFEGIPWNLDRRLSPGGCLKGGCEPLAGNPIGTFALDPFPYTGLDPRIQADFLVAGLPGGTPKGAYSDSVYSNSTLSNASNRVFSYVRGTPFAGGKYKFDGNNTLLPYLVGSFPADPGLVAITPSPTINLFPPFADEDAATTTAGAPIAINVLANDFPILGTIDPTSVKIAALPLLGTAQVNPATGVITYTPQSPSQTGVVTFTYTVANNFGSVSQPGTVTVTVLAAPTAANDAATVSVGSVTNFNLTANDLAGSNPLNLASLNIVAAPTCGIVANQLNGTVFFTAPAVAGTCVFSYVVSDQSVPPLLSNVATVTVTVIAPLVLPVAVNDSATVTSGTSVVISVAANDLSGSNPLNPASIAIAAAPAHGTATANAAGPGTVTYTPTAGFSGSDSFTYSIADTQGNAAPVNASVAITVNPAVSGETITITRAQYTLATGQWRIDGTTTARVAGQTMKIFNGAAVPADGVTGLLATVNVAANGTFTWTSATGAVPPNAQRKISVQSSIAAANRKEQITVTVR